MTKNAQVQDIRQPDMAEIEKRARQMRADAMRDFVKSVKAVFSRIGAGFSGQNAQA
jgi:hypothetical protein